MPAMTRLDAEKLRMRRIVATATLTAVAIAFLLISNAFAVVNLAQAAVGATGQGQVLDQQVANDRAQPEQGPADPVARRQADESPREPAAADGLPDDRAVAPVSLSEPGVPLEVAVPAPGASEQRVFKARRALETIDPRDFVQKAAMPK